MGTMRCCWLAECGPDKRKRAESGDRRGKGRGASGPGRALVRGNCVLGCGWSVNFWLEEKVPLRERTKRRRERTKRHKERGKPLLPSFLGFLSFFRFPPPCSSWLHEPPSRASNERGCAERRRGNKGPSIGWPRSRLAPRRSLLLQEGLCRSMGLRRRRDGAPFLPACATHPRSISPRRIP